MKKTCFDNRLNKEYEEGSNISGFYPFFTSLNTLLLLDTNIFKIRLAYFPVVCKGNQ